MNYLKKSFLKTTQKQTFKNSLYSTILKSKFRRSIQPGLTRYNYDEYDHQNGSMEFSRLSHKSNAEELITKVPPIEVDDNLAMCIGVNSYGWGHPTEYITLNTRYPEEPSVCKYCGLRYVRKAHH